jgi:CRISPR-associated protein Csh2
LNPVELNESSTITSSFSSGEGVGKDYRVKYSLIAFSGGINAHTAVETGLTPGDVAMFDKAMIDAIPANRTRSKTNQWPRFYLRVELVDSQVVLKDLREYIGLEYKTENPYAVRSIDDVSLDISKLSGYLRAREAVIAKIIYWKDDSMDIPVFPEFKAFFQGKIEELDTLTG